MSNSSQPYFVISVVSKMLNIHPQTIRHYERLGLINPHRTDGNVRLYSQNDIEKLEQICSFTELGINLAGVEVIINLLEKMEQTRLQMEDEMLALENELKRLKKQFDS